MPDDLKKIVKTVAPGTQLREGLENVLRAKTGGLIVVGMNAQLQNMMDGGFAMNCKCTPTHLYELSKMDGAIILSDDASEILFANIQLLPERNVPSVETGIRHRTAERVARATGKLVISISQRRNIITLYKSGMTRELNEIPVVLTKAMQAINTLERYKNVLNNQLRDLSVAEFEDTVTGFDVIQVIQKFIIVKRLSQEIEDLLIELGTEGRLVRMQLDDLIKNVDDEAAWLLKDYVHHDKQSIEVKDMYALVKKTSKDATSNYLIDSDLILHLLGYGENELNMLEQKFVPRGYRILSRISKLNKKSLIQKIVERFERFPNILAATVEELDEVDGIGTFLARTTKEGLRRIREDRLNIRS